MADDPARPHFDGNGLVTLPAYDSVVAELRDKRVIRSHQTPGNHLDSRHRAALLTRVSLAGIVALVLIGTVLWVVSGPNDGASRLTVYGVFVEGSAGIVIVLTYALVTIFALNSRSDRFISCIAEPHWLDPARPRPVGESRFLDWQFPGLSGSHRPEPRRVGRRCRMARKLGIRASQHVPDHFILMLVPDGRLPSPRWRILPWLAAIGIAGWSAAQMFGEYLGVEPRRVPNPFFDPTVFRLGDFLTLLLGAAFAGAVASIVMRFRRTRDTGRQQIKWVAYGGVIEVIMTLAVWLFSAVRPSSFGATAIAAAGVASLITPVAMSMAILKHRLYDIDRLISRTVAYAVVASTLASIYAAVTIGLPQILRLPTDSPLLVAIATLAAAGLFRPLSRRLRALVDRRFNRSRYDAQGEIDRFTSDLARTVDLDHVISETSAILHRTVQPDEVSVWIRRTE